MRIPPPRQLRLDLYDERPFRGDAVQREALDVKGDAACPTLVPPGREFPLGDDRVRVVLHFPFDLMRSELREVFRWIGGMAGNEVDRIFDEWELARLHAAGVPIRPVAGAAQRYDLDSLALCGPAAEKRPASRPPTGVREPAEPGLARSEEPPDDPEGGPPKEAIRPKDPPPIEGSGLRRRESASEGGDGGP